jgi:DNA (cytosine-5)-methyltransferase 1
MGDNQVAVAFAQNTRDEVRLIGGDGMIAGALAAQPGMKQTTYLSFHIDAMPDQMNFSPDTTATLTKSQHAGIQQGFQVRRLSPIECARLQGFPDSYLDIQFKGKPAADGHKYKALGNSMAVPVMRYIGKRILDVLVDDLI